MKRVLIVDDEEDIGILMSSMLRSAGYEVEYADSADAARDLLEHKSFQTIFLDLNLGQEHGFNLLSAISENQNEPNIVVITAYDEPWIRRDVLNKGIKHFIPKPFNKSQILELVA